MNIRTIIDKMKTMAESANIEANREVFGYFLYGSQNYGLADENSDIDIYCITVPSYEEILFGYKRSNVTYKTEKSSKNQITTKNLIDFFKELDKGNFTTLELLFTPYVIINEKYADEWEEIKNMRFSFLQGNPNKTMNSILGQAKSYLNVAKEKEEKGVPNGKPLANYLRLIEAADKYSNHYTNLYELSAARSTVLINIKNSSEVFRVGPREVSYELYENCKTTLVSSNINEKNKKALIELFKEILAKGDR